MSNIAYILLGSNIGDREEVMRNAIAMMESRSCRLIASSYIYETESWGFVTDDVFLNQVICIETSLDPHDLLKELLSIEIQLGRDREHHYDTYVSRPIDLDILYYNDIVLNDYDLILPHPKLHLRRFTLMPLCDVAPNMMHPVLCLSNSDLLARCEDTLMVKRYK